jgi:hypothetical protein
MINHGRFFNHCFRRQNLAVDLKPIPNATFSMGFSVSFEAALPGVHCLMIGRLTALSITIFASGVSMAPGVIFMMSDAVMCASLKADTVSPLPPVLILNR